MDFTELNLNETLMAGITTAGYVTCTPVQEQVLKGALDGSDLYVQSQTGTGKTAAYLISIIQERLSRQETAGKKALIMVPTRELAVQVEEEARILSKSTGLKTGSFYGGVGYDRQKSILNSGVDIIIGTPGRVIDLQESNAMDLSDVAFLVIDEADRMFDMGFYPDLRTLLKVLPKPEERQTMLFSATLNTYVKNLAWEYTVDAKEITIEAEQITVDEIDQILLHVSSDEKIRLLLGILNNEKPESVIVFCNTKKTCEIVAKRLQLNGIESEFIIGDLPQSKRLQVLESFKRGSLKCLVATDVAARGIDVSDLSMVVNYDLPNEAENYVHRIGRTARAGKTGKAYSFCSEQDVYNLPAIERYLESPIPASMPGEEMLSDDKSAGVYIQINNYDDDEYSSHRDGKRSTNYKGNHRSNGGRYSHNDIKAKDRQPYSGKRDSYKNRNDNQVNPETINAVAIAAGNTKSGENNYNKDSLQNQNNGASFSQKSKYGHSRTRKNGNPPRNSNSFKKETGKDYSSQYGNNSANDVDMSKLSFEERMKLYKEKYANTTQQSPSDNPDKSAFNKNRRQSNQAKKQNYSNSSSRKQNKPYNSNTSASENRNSKQQKKAFNDKRYSSNKNSYNTQPKAQNNNATKQKGFFSRLKSLFARGK